MTKFEYPVLAFRQQKGAPIEVAFVAYAGDVLKWSGIPRKSDELLTGFQRFKDEKRIDQEIVPFFANPANCSPTAIIVALRKDSGIGKCVLKDQNVAAGAIVQTTLVIELDEKALETDEVFSAAQEYVDKRLGAEADEADDSEEEDEAEADDDEEDDDEDEDEEIVHLGSVTLKRMKEELDKKSNWENQSFRAAIADYIKPVFLIDGQHRVSAAAKFGAKGLPFMVCGLFDTPWEEQVFQFTVVNLKPKRIPPALITSIAGLSLTREEQDSVGARLAQARVKMAEVSIMSLVAYEDKSPFADQIDMAVGGPSDKDALLGYGGMKRLAKVWYRASRTSLTLIAKQLYQTHSVSNARRQWRDDRAWFDFFCAFWDAVRRHYPSSLWQKSSGNKLFVAAHLWALQEVLLGAADGQVPSYWELKDTSDDEAARARELQVRLVAVVENSVPYFPAEMWSIEWAKGSQDTNQGRLELKTLFEKFVEEGKKAGRVWKNWPKDPWFLKA